MTTRRNLLVGAGLAAVGALRFDDVARALVGTGGFNAPDTIGTAPAVRGQQVQIVAPPPPPPVDRWDPGDFVNKVVDLPERAMSFTFDDGPSPSNTYRVLHALAERNVKATFFLVGVNVLAYPQIARDIVSEGHELGNHSLYHSPYRASSLAAQISGNQDVIEAATGVRPVVSRAPGLTRGSVILSTCRALGMYEVHTRMSTSDYLSPRWSASRLVSQFASNLSTGQIPIYHDGGPSRPTRDAVPSMVSIAQSRSYRCLPVTDLVNAGRPTPGAQTYAGLTDDHDDEHVESCCPFDPYAAFVERLEDPTVSAAERSRIVEQLAMLDDHRRNEAE